MHLLASLLGACAVGPVVTPSVERDPPATNAEETIVWVTTRTDDPCIPMKVGERTAIRWRALDGSASGEHDPDAVIDELQPGRVGVRTRRGPLPSGTRPWIFVYGTTVDLPAECAARLKGLPEEAAATGGPP